MEFPGGSDSYLAISGEAHHFLSSSDVRLSSTFPAETFHTPSLGDEDLDLDPDSALGVSDVVSDFGELGEDGPSGVPGNAVVGGNDPSFASTFVSTPSQSLEHLSLNQQSGGPMLGPALGMDLSQFSSSSPDDQPDVPLSDMNPGLLGHNQLTTIDQSELSAQLGLSLPRPQSPDQPLSADSLSDSLQDEDVDDFRRKSALVDPPLSLSVSLSASLSEQPAVPASSAAPAQKGVGGKKGKKKKDPNEPQKPVSAYALFFRDTQAAIKGQNPSATFGEVSKIVASMWDSLGEEQKQVYKRKTEAAKKEYLKALAAYKANQLQTAQPSIEVLDAPVSPPEPVTPPRSSRIQCMPPDNNTITNICTSNIILDLPQVTTRSRTGAHKPQAPPPANKILISKQQLQSPRQPPPLQQMQNTPPPPRLQQMLHSPAPPPLQAKPRVIATATPPPLQIKFVPVAQSDASAPIIVTTAESPAAEVPPPTAIITDLSPTATEEVTEEGMEVELNVSLTPDAPPADAPSVCVRAGCNNTPTESKDRD
ncbi:TOX high mobility group box family member 4-B-like, partial [Cyprinus carpio]|uniref:TOX high mobility group box family member 4-B-like n=1 Tax=Cyprinus carpio TaxID=7962 RepID=A0A9Q9WK05_CYPCA